MKDGRFCGEALAEGSMQSICGPSSRFPVPSLLSFEKGTLHFKVMKTIQVFIRTVEEISVTFCFERLVPTIPRCVNIVTTFTQCVDSPTSRNPTNSPYGLAL